MCIPMLEHVHQFQMSLDGQRLLERNTDSNYCKKLTFLKCKHINGTVYCSLCYKQLLNQPLQRQAKETDAMV